MNKIIVLLCLGLIGCATVAKESKTPPRTTKKPAVVNEMELDDVISVFSEAIKRNPKNTGAYYNRAVAYFYKKDYDRCWKDVHKAERLGYKFSPEFIKSLKQASGREK
jgi:hypothetical protein